MIFSATSSSWGACEVHREFVQLQPVGSPHLDLGLADLSQYYQLCWHASAPSRTFYHLFYQTSAFYWTGHNWMKKVYFNINKNVLRWLQIYDLTYWNECSSVSVTQSGRIQPVAPWAGVDSAFGCPAVWPLLYAFDMVSGWTAAKLLLNTDCNWGP